MTPRRPSLPNDDVRRAQVRARYGKIAGGSRRGDARSGSSSCCGGSSGTSCCGGASGDSCCGSSGSTQLGYAEGQLATLPDGADLGLGCGNPTALASLRPGEVVLDLGSGGGIDCFLASRKVGAKGRVIGVDMTPEMLSRARESLAKGRYPNVEFRLGEIEHLPLADASVDVVISNCVINLAPDKGQVYREAFRVLRPGGRLAVSDMVATRRLTLAEKSDAELWGSCASGALEAGEIRRLLRAAGFGKVEIDLKGAGAAAESLRDSARLGVVSADIRATKLRR